MWVQEAVAGGTVFSFELSLRHGNLGGCARETGQREDCSVRVLRTLKGGLVVVWEDTTCTRDKGE